MPGRTYTTLLDRAQEQYGYLTPDDAREIGANPAQLRAMVSRKTLEHIDRGLFRMPTVPPTALDSYMHAVLWTGRKGVLSHATALDLHELCDVNPNAIHLTVPKGYRTTREAPPTYELHWADLDDREMTWHEGLPIVNAERAILGGIEQALGWNLLDQAIETARARGLITREAVNRLSAHRYLGPT